MIPKYASKLPERPNVIRHKKFIGLINEMRGENFAVSKLWIFGFSINPKNNNEEKYFIKPFFRNKKIDNEI
jgi:hypothetical protein